MAFEGRFGGKGGWSARYSSANTGAELNWRDIELKIFLEDLKNTMPSEIMTMIMQSGQKVRDAIKDYGKELSTQYNNAAYEKIADSIKLQMIVDGEYTGASIYSHPKPEGVYGSRGIPLAWLYSDYRPKWKYDEKVATGRAQVIHSKAYKMSNQGTKGFLGESAKEGFPGIGSSNLPIYDYVSMAEYYFDHYLEEHIHDMLERKFGISRFGGYKGGGYN